LGNILGNIFSRTFAKSPLFKKKERRERRTLDPHVVHALTSRCGATGQGAVSILETPPFIRRRVDDRVRELVMSRMATGPRRYYFDLTLGAVRISPVGDQRWVGYE